MWGGRHGTWEPVCWLTQHHWLEGLSRENTYVALLHGQEARAFLSFPFVAQVSITELF